MVQWLSHWFPTFSGWGDLGSNPDPAGAGADEKKNSLSVVGLLEKKNAKEFTPCTKISLYTVQHPSPQNSNMLLL